MLKLIKLLGGSSPWWSRCTSVPSAPHINIKVIRRPIRARSHACSVSCSGLKDQHSNPPDRPLTLPLRSLFPRAPPKHYVPHPIHPPHYLPSPSLPPLPYAGRDLLTQLKQRVMHKVLLAVGMALPCLQKSWTKMAIFFLAEDHSHAIAHVDTFHFFVRSLESIP